MYFNLGLFDYFVPGGTYFDLGRSPITPPGPAMVRTGRRDLNLKQKKQTNILYRKELYELLRNYRNYTSHELVSYWHTDNRYGNEIPHIFVRSTKFPESCRDGRVHRRQTKGSMSIWVMSMGVNLD